MLNSRTACRNRFSTSLCNKQLFILVCKGKFKSEILIFCLGVVTYPFLVRQHFPPAIFLSGSLEFTAKNI